MKYILKHVKFLCSQKDLKQSVETKQKINELSNWGGGRSKSKKEKYIKWCMDSMNKNKAYYTLAFINFMIKKIHTY